MSTNIRNTIFFELKIIKEYWQIISIVGTVIFFGVYFWIENKDANERLKELTSTNKQLMDRISRLEGQVDVINSNMVLFVERNPGLTTYRLEMLEEAVDVQHIINSLNKKNETEIRIIQVPPTIVMSNEKPTQQIVLKSDTKNTEITKKRNLFRKN